MGKDRGEREVGPEGGGGDLDKERGEKGSSEGAGGGGGGVLERKREPW